MTERSSISDSLVMRETKLSDPDDKGRVSLKYTLPSGRVIVSTDRLVPGEIKGKVLIAWANAIRDQDAYDIQERDEREQLARVEKRAQEDSLRARASSGAPVGTGVKSSGPSGSAVPSAGTSKGSSSQLPDDPRELIIEKLRTLTDTHDALVIQRDECEAQLIKVRASISGWLKVGEGLGIDLGTKSTETVRASAKPQRRTPRKQRLSRDEEQQLDMITPEAVSDKAIQDA